MADDHTPDLRALANRWAMLARDYARDAKAVDATDAQVNYRKGIADGYYKAATELAELIKKPGSGASSSGASSASSANGAKTAPTEPTAAPFTMMGNGGADPRAGDPRAASARTQPLTDEMKAAVRQARSTGSNPAVVAEPPAAQPAAPAPSWEKVSMGEVLSILSYAGTNVRDITENKDNSFLLVFSSWENIMPHVRVERIQKSDLRVVILKTGKMKETNDPFIELAFKPM